MSCGGGHVARGAPGNAAFRLQIHPTGWGEEAGKSRCCPQGRRGCGLKAALPGVAVVRYGPPGLVPGGGLEGARAVR